MKYLRCSLQYQITTNLNFLALASGHFFLPLALARGYFLPEKKMPACKCQEFKYVVIWCSNEHRRYSKWISESTLLLKEKKLLSEGPQSSKKKNNNNTNRIKRRDQNAEESRNNKYKNFSLQIPLFLMLKEENACLRVLKDQNNNNKNKIKRRDQNSRFLYAREMKCCTRLWLQVRQKYTTAKGGDLPDFCANGKDNCARLRLN